MNESGNGRFISKKTYEVAYALWRIAANASQPVFADILRKKAMELVGHSADANYSGMDVTTSAVEGIIKFAVDVNCISIGNAAILVREIGNLKNAISMELVNFDMGGSFSDGLDISDFFCQEEMQGETEIELPEILPVSDMSDEGEKMRQETNVSEISKKAEMRQSAILEKIRQNGDCRLADIQAILPDVSERTIRYDLESLVQRNLIGRFGPGGRAVYYRAT